MEQNSKGGTWKPASDLKEINFPVCIKYDGGGTLSYGTATSLQMLNAIVSKWNHIKEIQYLDEALPPVNSKEDYIKAIEKLELDSRFDAGYHWGGAKMKEMIIELLRSPPKQL